MMSSSRPFLSMMNPIGRTHQGYVQANQLLVEENEDDLEAGHPTRGILSRSTKSHGKRRVSWDGESSEMNVLRPNIRKEDKTYEQDNSDDDVPQRFMIEDSPMPDRPSRGKGRSQPLYSTSARSVPQATVHPTDTLPGMSIPPRPSEVDVDEPPQTLPQRREHIASPKPMRGLDDYERALWNWVNVYNLDAFLQEVYLYYEGKGIYSIALARGLNLLSVVHSLVVEPNG
jgi:autophagy-related protein 9